MITNFTKQLLIVVACFTIFSCSREKKINLTPDQVIKLDQQDVLRFNSFDGMAPLFSHQDDTLRVINFWATWCKPCVEELPHFVELEKEFKASGQKAKVILVSLDMNEKNLSNYIKKKNLTTQSLWLDDPNANAWISKVNQNWDGAIPVTLLIGPNKNVFHNSDFSSFEELKAFISEK